MLMARPLALARELNVLRESGDALEHLHRWKGHQEFLPDAYRPHLRPMTKRGRALERGLKAGRELFRQLRQWL